MTEPDYTKLAAEMLLGPELELIARMEESIADWHDDEPRKDWWAYQRDHEDALAAITTHRSTVATLLRQLAERDADLAKAREALNTRPPDAAAETLAKALRKVLPVAVENGPDFATVYFGDGSTHSTQAMTMNPQDWLDIEAALTAWENLP